MYVNTNKYVTIWRDDLSNLSISTKAHIDKKFENLNIGYFGLINKSLIMDINA